MEKSRRKTTFLKLPVFEVEAEVQTKGVKYSRLIVLTYLYLSDLNN
jgi:hypothetical protein